MGTLNIPLTGIDPNGPIPGVYAEVRYAQGDVAGDQSPKKVLIIASKTAAGALTPDTAVGGPYATEAAVIADCGAGSPAHRMAKRFLSLCKSALVFIVAPAVSAGSAGVEKLTLTFSSLSNPAASGTANVAVCNVICTYAFTTSDTVTTIAAGLAAAINAQAILPVTASSAIGVLTITAKIIGAEPNSIRWSAFTQSGSATNLLHNGAATQPDAAFGTSGQAGAAIGITACSYTNALATVLATKYDYIVPHVQDATNLGLLSTQVLSQALPTTGFRQQVISGSSLSTSAATTVATGLNNPRMQLANQNASPEEHYLTAASVAAVRVLSEISDPSTNYDSYGLKSGNNFSLKAPALVANWPVPATDFLTALNNGVTPIGVSDAGTAYIVRSVTTRSLNGGTADYRARDTSVVTLADKFAGDAAAKIRNAPFSKITDDPIDSNSKQPPAAFNTPKRTRMLIETLMRDYNNNGWINPSQLQTMILGMATGVNSTNPSRMDVATPFYAAIMLHATALLVEESSPSV